MKYTEKRIQRCLYSLCQKRGHRIITPNSQVFGWESDLISITRSNFVFEFEIKISKADFKSDAGKKRTRLLENPVVKSGSREITVARPNYFSYVVPVGMIEVCDVPDYAGLIYLGEWDEIKSYSSNSAVSDENHCLHWAVDLKSPKRLHDTKIKSKDLMQIAGSLSARYWRQLDNARTLLKTNDA